SPRSIPPTTSRRWTGSPLSTLCCWPPSSTPPPPASTPTPGNWPGPWRPFSTGGGTGTIRPPSAAPPGPPPPPLPGPTAPTPRARAYPRAGPFHDAHPQLSRPLDLAAQTGDQNLQAHTPRNLAILWERRADYPQALDHTRQALTLFQATGHQFGQAA